MARKGHSLAVLTSTGAQEWYTPPVLAVAARAVLGHIDLDPASCAEANAVIQAARYYTKEDNGLVRLWRGRVWLNPPFGSLGPRFVARLHYAYRIGDVTAALLLVPARVDTRWWRLVQEYPVCFLHGRVRFSNVSDSAPFATAILYLGRERERFVAVFGRLGLIYECVQPATAGAAVQGYLAWGDSDENDEDGDGSEEEGMCRIM